MHASSSASACKDSEALSILGLQQNAHTRKSADSQSLDSSAASILCLRKQSQGAKKASKATLDNLEEIFSAQEPKAGDHLRCPCGWTPPPGTKTAQYTKAAQHWHKCRGEKPPQAPKKQKLAVLAQAGQTAAQIAKDSAEASWTTWTKEISEKHPHLASSICQPNFDVPFYSPKMGRQFPCKVCGQQRGFNRMRRFPCKKRPADITIRQWQTTIFGKFLDPGRKSSETRSRKDPAWRRRAADKAAAKRRENGALEGQGRRRDLLKKHE